MENEKRTPAGKEIRIQNVSENMIQKLDNISKNLGVPMTSLIKTELRVIIDKYPEHWKQKPLD